MILPVYLDGDEVEVVSEHLKKLNHKEWIYRPLFLI
jgi:hypothetical protein